MGERTLDHPVHHSTFILKSRLIAPLFLKIFGVESGYLASLQKTFCWTDGSGLNMRAINVFIVLKYLIDYLLCLI